MLAATGALALALGSPAASRAQTARAHTASSVSVKDEGNLRLVHSSGSTLTDEGTARGTIPGSVALRFVYNGDPTVTALLTIHGHAGTIQARATARLSNPSSRTPSFQGTLIITRGSGRYAHASGTGMLYGVFDRRSYALTVQTRGTLHY
jgi:hypothetical protein